MRSNSIRIGTRGSQLALYQANETKRVIEEKFSDITAEIVVIHTKGDKILDVSLAKIGDKGLFTKELEVALVNREVDMAVHSLKDLPTFFPKGLKLGAVLKRGEVRDAWVSKNGKLLGECDENDVIATSSLRRKAQLLAYNPRLNIIDIRGNMNTRLEKMQAGHCDAMIMAATGLQRLGLEDKITEIIDLDIMLPAVSQGAIGIETRQDDDYLDEIMAGINHDQTMQIITAERAYLKSMEGGCQIPIGCYSDADAEKISFTGLVADLKGEKVIKVTRTGNLEDIEKIALMVSQEMIAQGAVEILDEIRNNLS